MAKANPKVRIITDIGEATLFGDRKNVEFLAQVNLKPSRVVLGMESAIRLRNQLTAAIAAATPRLREPGVL